MKTENPPEGERNVPTPEGRALGAQLARLFEAERPKTLARFPNAPEPCKSCAYRAGTFPNGCPETVIEALYCAVDGIPFYCHMDMKDGKPTKLCAGWATLQGGDCVPALREFMKDRPRPPTLKGKTP